MPVGGFSTIKPGLPLPEGARAIASSSTWQLGQLPVRSAQGLGRRIFVVGPCGASDDEVQELAAHPVLPAVTWRWPGTYAVVEEGVSGTVVHTDPAGALPLYTVSWEGTWAWCTSARFLGALGDSRLDAERLACAVLAPALPVLSAGRTFFTNVHQLPPGSRTELPNDGRPYQCLTTWWPEPLEGALPHLRLRRALTFAVRLRASIDPRLSSDLSGGFDSTTVAILAARATNDPLRAVTIHPEGILDGADLSYARITADNYKGQIEHHLLPLTVEHRPYTHLTEVPVTDEPAPSTLTHVRLREQLHWMHETLGTRTHLTGDGGDSILFQPPAHLADLVRHHRYRRAGAEALGWARLRHTPVGPLLRDAAAMARTPRVRALEDLVVTLATGTSERQNAGNVGWFPSLPVPSWATPVSRRHLVRAAKRAAAEPDPLSGLDASVRVLVDEIREVARTAVADAELAAGCGIELHNPFLDPLVVDSVLRTPLHGRPPLYAYKPNLVKAFSDVLPVEIRERTTKGSFEADHYSGLRAALPELLDQAGLHLAALGLIDLPRFRNQLRRAAVGMPMPLATIEQALTADAWMHSISHAPAPQWILPTPETVIR
ncbi:albusnodin/ikarugamycin family macrolactam cyclase [Streptomyces sp. NPDC058861]|uniref:albusnodin/ikarugamycin family macrolactam cyclase n=1 Tax=Streptomyces sp. NPDC058861 TaxID=3346653 RepID=UPI0036CFFE27